MAHIYMLFDFATDEEKAQLARHQLEVWKQAFRLDKKILYKFERTSPSASDAETPDGDASEKSKSKGKSKAINKDAEPKESVKLLVRLDFSAHEKISGERWVARIPTETPFKDAHPAVITAKDKKFGEIEKQFEDLA
jgi:hypothetical protein